MRYANTNTNRALRDLVGMVAAMPENRSLRTLREAKANNDNLKTLAGLKRAEMEQPSLQLQRQQAQDTLDIHNAPANISQLVGNIGGDLGKSNYSIKNTPSQGAMWVQHQKNVPGVDHDVPPAIQQAIENIKHHYGATVADDGTILDKTGKPIPNHKAGEIVNEFRRVKLMNMDPLKARDERVSLLQSMIDSGRLSDKDVKNAQYEIDGLKNTPEADLRERYLSKLNQYTEEDKLKGRPQGVLWGPMVQEQVDKIARLRAGEAKAEKRQYEMNMKLFDNQLELSKLATEYGLKKELEKVKKNGLGYKELESYMTGSIKNALALAGIRGNAKDGYYISEGNDPETGEEKLVPADAKAGEIMEQQRVRNSYILKYYNAAKKAGEEITWPDAALEMDIQETNRRHASQVAGNQPNVDAAAVEDIKKFEKPPEVASVEPVAEPKLPEKQGKKYKKVLLDTQGSGNIYGKTEDGKTVLIMRKPSQKIYNNRYDNPDYAKYLELLKQYGLK
jgi:hypothetical protein